MQGRRALALMLTAAALGGCGGEAGVEPASIAIVESGAKARPQPPRTQERAGDRRTGTLRTPQLVPAPPPARAIAPATAKAGPAVRTPRHRSVIGNRAGLLEVLRAHCATRPANDPRCDGARVNERVALAGQEDQR